MRIFSNSEFVTCYFMRKHKKAKINFNKKELLLSEHHLSEIAFFKISLF